MVSLDDPLNPQIVNADRFQTSARGGDSVSLGFVVDDEGLKVIDVTNCRSRRGLSNGAFVSLADAHDVYVARTYAYVANGKEGVAIIDVNSPSSRASIRCTTPKASSTTCTR